MAEALDTSCVLDLRMIPFYDGGVQKIYDHSGYGNHGTPVGFVGDDVEYQDYGNGVEIYFGTTAAAKRLNCGTFINLTAKTLTVEVFVRMATAVGTDNTYRQFITKEATSAPFSFDFVRSGLSTGVRFGTNGIGAVSEGSNVSADNNYHYFVGTNDGVNNRLYRDGILLATTASGVIVDDGVGAALYVGYNSVGRFCGLVNMSRTTIYTRPMGAAEIYERYLAWAAGRL